nr:MAG TPA: replisome organizer [Caudoviricetes sp.]
MAKRRMFSLDIVDTDIFLDMPPTTQNLYFHLGMRADDDGFVAAPKKIAKLCNGTPDDIKILVAKGYIIPFDDGVVLVTDWMINNQIRKDRYTETRFKEHLNTIVSEDGRYKKSLATKWQPNGNQMATDGQPSIGKDSIGEYSTDKVSVSTNDNITKDDNNYMFTTTSVSTGRREDDYDYHYFNAPEYDNPPFK